MYSLTLTFRHAFGRRAFAETPNPAQTNGVFDSFQPNVCSFQALFDAKASLFYMRPVMMLDHPRFQSFAWLPWSFSRAFIDHLS